MISPLRDQLQSLYAAARLALTVDFPYFAVAALSIQCFECDEVPTAGVDNSWRLYMNPDYCLKLTVQQMKGLLVHELSHVLWDHGDRAKLYNAEPTIWNLAADCAINGPLKAQHVELPPNGIIPTDFGFPDGELTEEYYDRFRTMAQQGKLKIEVIGVGRGDCGSGANGQKKDYELPEAGSGQSKDSAGNSANGVDRLEADRLRKHTATAIKDASKTRGNMPAGWDRWADEIISPKVDWRRELPAAIRATYADAQRGNSDYSYFRPSRRQSAYMHDGRGVVMPTMVQTPPRGGILVDTSGSMGDEEMRYALGTIKDVLTTCGAMARIKVWSCDAAVHTSQDIFDVHAVKLAGGGGTDMTVGIAVAEAARPPLDFLIVYTDCFTPWPAHKPKIPQVIIAAVGDGQLPEWPHRLVRIEPKKRRK